VLARPRATARGPLVAVAALLGLAATARGGDVLDGLGGTWGLPPIDGQPGLTGSYFSLQRMEDGGLRARLSLNPGDWSCGASTEVAWSPAAARFEWPNRSSAGAACWLRAAPVEEGLDLRIWCPYDCTSGDAPRQLSLERIAADRLSPPENVVDTFCSSHDALRQELCRPGELQQLIAAGNLEARRRGVLDEGKGDVPPLPETDRELRSILDACHAAGAGLTCLRQALQRRRAAAAAALAARQQALAEERRRSEAAAVSLAADAAQAWQGAWSLVTDAMLGSLRLQSCDGTGCSLSVEGQTNYVFGYEERHGGCSLTGGRLIFTSEDRGFSYLEPAARDAEGAGPFANFCRIDLSRTPDGFRVGLRGVGCSEGCLNAQFPELAGEYHARPSPSFECPPDTGQLPWDEENLCLDPGLAALDRELATAFAEARAAATGPARAALVDAQRAWIAARRSDCDGGQRRTCLARAYRTRLRELQARY
jgi:uncharacterized protein YecT (DUF1311 family)